MKPGREINRLGLGSVVLTIATLIVLGVLAGIIGPQMFSGGGRRVSAVFADAQQLKPGDEVRVQGVLEGTVSSVTLDPGGRSATVVMSVPDSAGPLYRDATATIASKTLLGGAFNIDLTRGHAAAGSLGSHPIPLSRTFSQIELDDVLSVDAGGARSGLKRMLPELATALSNPGPPAQLLGTVADRAPVIARGVRALRGLVPDSDLRALVTGTASALDALDAPDDGLRGLVQGASATVTVTAARAGAIEAALDTATPAMDQAKTTFAQLRETLSLANPLLRSLAGSAPQVAPTVAHLHPTVVGARTLLDGAVPLLHALPPALRSLAVASRQGLPLLNGLQPSFDRLQHTILPYLNTIDPESGHTTAEMIGPTVESLGPSSVGQEDQYGHFIRFPATAGSSPFYLPCQTYFGNPSDHNQLLACSSLQDDLSAFLNYNPVSQVLGEAAAAGNGSGSPPSGSDQAGAASHPASPAATVRSVLSMVADGLRGRSSGGEPR